MFSRCATFETFVIGEGVKITLAFGKRHYAKGRRFAVLRAHLIGAQRDGNRDRGRAREKRVQLGLVTVERERISPDAVQSLSDQAVRLC
jgi:hypothetical protein